MWAILIGVVVGLAAAGISGFHIPSAYSTYMAIGILASLDSVFGGFSAYISKNFRLKIFVTGLVFNSAIAAALVYLGKLLGVDLSLAAVVVFGSRIIQNFAIIRRLLLNKFEKKDRIIDNISNE